MSTTTVGSVRDGLVGVAPSDRVPARLGPASLALTFAALTWWTWAGWPDPVVDFGREVVAPATLASGGVLHRDVAWFNGPVSAYWNALWMALLGPTFRTLFLVNLALTAAFTALMYRVLRVGAGALAAWLGSIVFLTCFAFGQQLDVGNYNWIAPYAHETTHGVMLGALGLAAWSTCWRRRSIAWARVWGGATGLACLTKPETAVAAIAGFAVAAALVWRERDARPLVSTAGLWLLIPTVVAGGLFGLALPPREALAAALGAWRGLFEPEVAALPFYRAISGLDAPADHLVRAVVSLAGWIALLAPFAVASWLIRDRGGRAARMWQTAGVAVVAWLAWLTLQPALPATAVARALPLLLAAGIATTGWRAWREPASWNFRAERLVFAVWSLALLAKMVLAARLSHYGFALAVPAVLFVVAGLAGWWPERCARAGRSPWIAEGAAVGLALVVVTTQLVVTAAFQDRKTTVVGRGSDAVRADDRGRLVQQALTVLAAHGRPGDTLAVLPEGATLNRWSGLANPTPYLNFMPPELLLFGEDRIRGALDAAAPTWLVLVHKDTSEYGVPLFGRDYGRPFPPWIATHYEVVETIGDPPLQPGSRFGLAVLRRKVTK